MVGLAPEALLGAAEAEVAAEALGLVAAVEPDGDVAVLAAGEVTALVGEAALAEVEGDALPPHAAMRSTAAAALGTRNLGTFMDSPSFRARYGVRLPPASGGGEHLSRDFVRAPDWN